MLGNRFGRHPSNIIDCAAAHEAVKAQRLPVRVLRPDEKQPKTGISDTLEDSQVNPRGQLTHHAHDGCLPRFAVTSMGGADNRLMRQGSTAVAEDAGIGTHSPPAFRQFGGDCQRDVSTSQCLPLQAHQPLRGNPHQLGTGDIVVCAEQ